MTPLHTALAALSTGIYVLTARDGVTRYVVGARGKA